MVSDAFDTVFQLTEQHFCGADTNTTGYPIEALPRPAIDSLRAALNTMTGLSKKIEMDELNSRLMCGIRVRARFFQSIHLATLGQEMVNKEPYVHFRQDVYFVVSGA